MTQTSASRLSAPLCDEIDAEIPAMAVVLPLFPF